MPCLAMQTLASIAETVKNFAVIYVVDITEARALHSRATLCMLRLVRRIADAPGGAGA
jgi:hypothetical protein